MDNWISIKDKLPPIDIPILIVEGENITAGEKTMSNMWWSENEYNSGEDITHWMPLPGLPTK